MAAAGSSLCFNPLCACCTSAASNTLRMHSHVKEKYPLAVGLPLGSSADYMVLMNPDLPGYELLLVWKITINEDGSVTPILDLLPKIPEQAMALDKTGVLDNAAMNFRALLQAFGLQATIENIIQSFCVKRSSH